MLIHSVSSLPSYSVNVHRLTRLTQDTWRVHSFHCEYLSTCVCAYFVNLSLSWSMKLLISLHQLKWDERMKTPHDVTECMWILSFTSVRASSLSSVATVMFIIVKGKDVWESIIHHHASQCASECKHNTRDTFHWIEVRRNYLRLFCDTCFTLQSDVEWMKIKDECNEIKWDNEMKDNCFTCIGYTGMKWDKMWPNCHDYDTVT